MIFYSNTLEKDLFNGLSDYKKYIKKFFFERILDLNIDFSKSIKLKKNVDSYHSVTPNLTTPFSPKLENLCRLHYLVIARKVCTILEFGTGKSTLIFNDALTINKKKYTNFVNKQLRKSFFECHTVDSNIFWVKKMRLNYNLKNVRYYITDVEMGTFNDRICTFYKKLSNVCPDFIYIDGPDQYSPKNSIRGIFTGHPERLPMIGDILALEYFFLPGTLLVIDGRTANARFLLNNLQRDWVYSHNQNFDQHFFELCENPLGILNKAQINFSLGDRYYVRLKKILLAKYRRDNRGMAK